MNNLNPAIDSLIQSLESNHKLGWIPYENISDVKSSPMDNVCYAFYKQTHTMVMLLLLGNSEECTPAFVSEFSRIYSLSIHNYNNDDNHFRRYTTWHDHRNYLIKGFTEYDGNYYMVADRKFYHCYSRYGFCTACGLLRCSPVWCICGHKQLSDGWTSNNHQLDDFIKKSQLQTNSPNDAYLEWIPFDCFQDYDKDRFKFGFLSGLPAYKLVKLIPLEITDDSYYVKLCDEHPDILISNVWVTIGFIYHPRKQKYYLIKEQDGHGLCLACTQPLEREIKAFCYICKAPLPVDWTTGNKSLDSFIMESWNNITRIEDVYIQWIKYFLLADIREMTSLRHGCTLIADWPDPVVNGLTQVALKKIVEGSDQLFDFRQLTRKYPTILTPSNIWVIGITQEPSTQAYYLVFYHEIRAIVDKVMHFTTLWYLRYNNFDEIKEIGSGGYRTVYTAKYKSRRELMPETVVLKRFKNFDETPELFLSELRNHAMCLSDFMTDFLHLYGITQVPEAKEYMIVLQYANHGSLLSYLDQNINKLTWIMKLKHLGEIAYSLCHFHYRVGLVLCDLHGGNIVMHNNVFWHQIKAYICDLGLAQSTKLRESNSIRRCILPFIAPEVIHTRKFTQKSDVYSFGIIMYLIATGEQPFGDREFNKDLIRDIMGGLRPSMPDSAPEEYKKLAEWCCDVDPDKRPSAAKLQENFDKLIFELKPDDSVWSAVYHSDVKPLSRLEKQSKCSSTLVFMREDSEE